MCRSQCVWGFSSGGRLRKEWREVTWLTLIDQGAEPWDTDPGLQSCMRKSSTFILSWLDFLVGGVFSNKQGIFAIAVSFFLIDCCIENAFVEAHA